jgi:hypothetical protein
MEEAPKKGKVLSHSAHANGMNETVMVITCTVMFMLPSHYFHSTLHSCMVLMYSPKNIIAFTVSSINHHSGNIVSQDWEFGISDTENNNIQPIQ